jgi:hypothetical protein
MSKDTTRLRRRVALSNAVLKEATAVIVTNHYLHRGRTMAQLAYWIDLDGDRVGVILFALPRLSVTYHGYHPMQLIELARLWISPDAQQELVEATDGTIHANAVAGCAVAAALRRVRADWNAKYPNLPKVFACVAWADLSRHRGTVYKATNFEMVGLGGGKRPGRWVRPAGGTHLDHGDYRTPKATYLYRWEHPDARHAADRAAS